MELWVKILAVIIILLLLVIVYMAYKFSSGSGEMKMSFFKALQFIVTNPVMAVMMAVGA